MLVVAVAKSNDCPEHLKMIYFKHRRKRLHQISLQGTNVSHLGKKKVIFKSGWGGDIFVPRRVVSWSLFPHGLLKDLQQIRTYMMCLILSSVADGVIRKNTTVICTTLPWLETWKSPMTPMPWSQHFKPWLFSQSRTPLCLGDDEPSSGYSVALNSSGNLEDVDGQPYVFDLNTVWTDEDETALIFLKSVNKGGGITIDGDKLAKLEKKKAFVMSLGLWHCWLHRGLHGWWWGCFPPVLPWFWSWNVCISASGIAGAKPQ